MYEPVRVNMGYARYFAEKIDLSIVRPVPETASSGFCLAAPGREYLVYCDESSSVNVQLPEKDSAYEITWFDPSSGRHRIEETAVLKGKHSFSAPWESRSVLLLKAED